MKKLIVVAGVLLYVFTGNVAAQGTAATKPQANQPAKTTAAKPAVKKEPRMAKSTAPDVEIKPVKK